jgi:glutamate dehydrogenase (NADP+)
LLILVFRFATIVLLLAVALLLAILGTRSVLTLLSGVALLFLVVFVPGLVVVLLVVALLAVFLWVVVFCTTLSLFRSVGSFIGRFAFVCSLFTVFASSALCAVVACLSGLVLLGVGGREVGYLFGMYKKLTHQFQGVLTGKGQEFGGSRIRPEATGYGNVYFLCNMLATKNIDIKGKTVLVSGSGNVAQYTMEKLLQLGAKPVTCSDSDGYIYDPDGIDREKLDYIMELKNVERGRIKEYAEKYGVKYVEGAKPWFEKADIALPSATQNEINEEAAKALVANGVFAVSEGANMPTTPEAIKVFQDAKILYAPGKAANAGGVAVSGLEMSQNSERLKWSREEVDAKLHEIMNDIHANCVKYGTEADGYVNYVKGANVAGFLKVAKAMMAQGIV